jgi:hypothetical protein
MKEINTILYCVCENFNRYGKKLRFLRLQLLFRNTADRNIPTCHKKERT